MKLGERLDLLKIEITSGVRRNEYLSEQKGRKIALSKKKKLIS